MLEETKDSCLSLPPVPFSPLKLQSAFSLSILPFKAVPRATIPILFLSPKASRPSMWKRRGGHLVVWYLDEEISGCFPGLGGLTVRAQGEALSPAPQLPHPLRRSSPPFCSCPPGSPTEDSAPPGNSGLESWGSLEGSMGPGQTSLHKPQPFQAHEVGQQGRSLLPRLAWEAEAGLDVPRATRAIAASSTITTFGMSGNRPQKGFWSLGNVT